MQSALRDDALTSHGDGVAVRLGLPWIRSLPLACVKDFAVVVDGLPLQGLQIELGERRIRPEDLIDEAGWWFLQDRLLLVADRQVNGGVHRVDVEFRAMIPYLMAGPGGAPLEIPLRVSRELQLDGEAVPSVSSDVA